MPPVDVFALLFATNQPFRDVAAAYGGALWWAIYIRIPIAGATPPPRAMAVTIPGARHHLFAGAYRRSGGLPVVDDYLISAACPRCGAPRGRPELQILADQVTGHYFCADVWTNPCGHVDSYADVLLEVIGQCQWWNCVAPASPGVCYPYCSPECAIADPLWAHGYRGAIQRGFQT